MKKKGSGPVPSKYALTVASANRADGKNCNDIHSQIFVTQPKAVVRHHRLLAWQALLQQMALIAHFSLILHQNHTDGYAQSKLSCFWSVCKAACFSSALKIIIQASVSYKIIKEKKAINSTCFVKFRCRILFPQNKSLGLISLLFSLYYDACQVFFQENKNRSWNWCECVNVCFYKIDLFCPFFSSFH